LEALEERQRHCIDIIRRTLPLLALQFPAGIPAGGRCCDIPYSDSESCAALPLV
jgi:hypothetical protein